MRDVRRPIGPSRIATRSRLGARAGLALAAAVAASSIDAAELAFDAATGRVEARGLDAAEAEALAADPDAMARALVVRVAPAEAPAKGDDDVALPSIVGRLAIDGDALAFVPRHGWRPGRDYRASWTAPGDGAAARRATTLAFSVPGPEPDAAAPTVEEVLPAGPVLPANLLRLHVRFSRPMRRGRAAEAIRLEGADGRTLPGAFLAIGREQWSADMRRLTLTLDPGRIKRGVRPNLEAGAPLAAGRAHALVIGAALEDRDGRALGHDVRRRFVAGPPFLRHPPLDAWDVGRVRSGTREPLAVRPPPAIDPLSAEVAVAVVDARGRRVPGRLRRDATTGSLRFDPERPWGPGARLRLDARLEDVAGNRRAGGFEMAPGTVATRAGPTAPAFLPIEVR